MGVKYAYIFGSYVREDYDPYNSDIDIAVFSEAINSRNKHSFVRKGLRLISKYKMNFEPFFFNLSDYAERDNDFIQKEIKQKGHKIWG